MPNTFAHIALFSWPLMAIIFFVMFPPRWACALTLVGGEMFLPPVFSVDLKGLPPIDKNLMASIAAIVACLIIKPRALLRGSRGDKGKRYNWFILLLIVGAFFTARTNPDPVRWEKLLFQGLTFHDFVSEAIRLVLFWWPPFFLGRKLFKRPEDLEALFTVLVVGGLVYSLFIFIEARLSPQLNIWIYGYHQADFRQSLRGGGFRPTVFMRHGLNVSLFILMTLLSAVGLARSGKRVVGIPVVWLAVYLAFVLLVCKSTGAVVYAIVIVPLLLIASARVHARFATTVAALVLCYPLLRFLGLVPVDDIVSFFNSLVGPERAESLAYRLKNEEILLARMALRPWFGWGGYGRQFTYDPWGNQISLADGQWILVMGMLGIVGFVGSFGLLLTPIFRFARRELRRVTSRSDALLASTALLMAAVYVFDLLPNAGLAPYLTMIIGALVGIKAEQPSPNDGAYYPAATS